MEHRELLAAACKEVGIAVNELGVMVVDHGSRRAESNAALLEVVQVFRDATGYPLVEPAHMELADPTIAQAYDQLVARGAKFIVVHPYFLLPGRHWSEDIPNLVAQAATAHPTVDFIVSSPLGIHPLMAQIMNDRILDCLLHRAGRGPSCDLCDDVGRCSPPQPADEPRNV